MGAGAGGSSDIRRAGWVVGGADGDVYRSWPAGGWVVRVVVALAGGVGGVADDGAAAAPVGPPVGAGDHDKDMRAHKTPRYVRRLNACMYYSARNAG